MVEASLNRPLKAASTSVACRTRSVDSVHLLAVAVGVRCRTASRANQHLTVRFPNLGANDVIVPGTARIAFNITLNGGEDDNRTVVNNLGRLIVKISVKLEGNEVFRLVKKVDMRRPRKRG